ncbi:YciI family protein [Aestuariibius sp. HNIBRBA575]|uniref:YciI family protein n=1 Tax=Aestuariibius sp. HNIBRBA575 TaxID=3233343 RepID=UPI0034A193A0
MQYMALIYSNPDLEPTPGTDEFNAYMADYFKINEIYKNDGVFVAGEPLEGIDKATSVQIRDGQTKVMDGPFADTKERLGGFYIFECSDLDQALKYAAMIPSAKYGTVEVRPLMVLS